MADLDYPKTLLELEKRFRPDRDSLSGIVELDAAVGVVLDALDRLEISLSSLVIYTSDYG